LLQLLKQIQKKTDNNSLCTNAMMMCSEVSLIV
jgi:hypothetical protein